MRVNLTFVNFIYYVMFSFLFVCDEKIFKIYNLKYRENIFLKRVM